MKKILACTFFFCSTQLMSQRTCVSGNCNSGFGKMTFAGSDSGRYEGYFLNGQQNGKGRYEDVYMIYTGEWKNGIYEGQGALGRKAFTGSRGKYSEEYIGTFKNGKYEGEGTWIYYLNGDSNLLYRGAFKDGHRFGKGSLRVFGMGALYSDSWTDNQSFDSGTIESEDKKLVRHGYYARNNFELDKTKPGSGFKTIHFHKSNSTILRQNVFEKELVSSYSSAKIGTISINTQTSILTISASGEPDKIYQIKSVGNEATDQWGNKSITIACTDADGLACSAVIKKQYAYTSSNEMLFNITYPNGTGRGYTCDLISNLNDN